MYALSKRRLGFNGFVNHFMCIFIVFVKRRLKSLNPTAALGIRFCNFPIKTEPKHSPTGPVDKNLNVEHCNLVRLDE